jgi:peptidyl-prolyl cis-trans isomerase SurA
VTNYEYDQRLSMLTLFGTQGDVEAEALQGLIDDRLRVFAAEQVGIKVTPEGLEAGMTEFAGRANLSLEEFLAALAQGGVEPESLRDFVEAGLLWREYVRALYAGTITITPAEIDRALAADTRRAAATNRRPAPWPTACAARFGAKRISPTWRASIPRPPPQAAAGGSTGVR